MKDILLCNPARLSYRQQKTMEAYPLLGHGYLASYLERSGFPAAIFDAGFEPKALSFEDILEAERPRIVGVYGHISSRRRAFAYARKARRQGVLTIAGGPDATGYYSEYLKAGFEVVVCGEGEETTRALAEWARAGAERSLLADIRGIAYQRDDGRRVLNEPRPHIKEIDSLPPPRRDEQVYAPYLSAWRKNRGFASLPIMGARGCPYNCAFCYRPIFGRDYRKRSPRLIVAELADCVQRFKVRHFRFIDDTFVVDPAWVRELSALVQQSGLGLTFEVLARPELITSEIAAELYAMGVRQVSLGMESGSERVLRAMDKGLRPGDSVRAAKILRAQGIEFLSWVMLGYPGEGKPDLQLTRDLLREARPDALSISFATPLAGTPYYSRVQAPARVNRPYGKLFYLFARRWLATEVAAEQARVAGSSSLALRALRRLYRAGMNLTGFSWARSRA